jgi:hypothetical protein
MDQHVRIVAVIYIVFGILGVLGGLALFALIAGIGAASGDTQATWITGTVGSIVGGILIVISLPSIIAGMGLQKRKEWARILTIILAVIHLFGFPIGTAIGGYTLWVLLSDQTRAYFSVA